jgi:hypothetical protein
MLIPYVRIPPAWGSVLHGIYLHRSVSVQAPRPARRRFSPGGLSVPEAITSAAPCLCLVSVIKQKQKQKQETTWHGMYVRYLQPAAGIVSLAASRREGLSRGERVWAGEWMKEASPNNRAGLDVLPPFPLSSYRRDTDTAQGMQTECLGNGGPWKSPRTRGPRAFDLSTAYGGPTSISVSTTLVTPLRRGIASLFGDQS